MRVLVFVAVLAVVVAAQPVGSIDTIGGTTYDASIICAGIQRLVTYDPGYGVHVAWSHSREMSNTAFPDRREYYNFRSDLTGEWVAIDSGDYMNSGVEVFDGYRTGHGGIDYDPVNHVPVMVVHGGSPIHPRLARDVSTGACIWEYADAPPDLDDYQWPWLAVSASGTVHLLPITAAYQLAYCRMSPWGTFGPVQNIFTPDPGFPSQMITASKLSDRAAVLWEESNTDEAFYLSQTADDGLTWSMPLRVEPPPAFGGDTVARFHISSLGANHDRDDNLNVVAAVSPEVGGIGQFVPADIWHWSASNTPNWHRIHRAECAPEHLGGLPGMNSIFAGRPKVAQNPRDGRLYVIWSQYDSMNVDPTTGQLRADVWLSASADNGCTWNPGMNLTGPDSASEMYCDIAPCVNDTLHIVYLADLVAGWFVNGNGPGTPNPLIYLRIPADAVGVAEPARSATARRPVGATVAKGVAGELFDITGRRVMRTGPGVYFARPSPGAPVRKVVIAR